MKSLLLNRAKNLLPLLFLISAWQGIYWANCQTQVLIPSPKETVIALFNLFSTEHLIFDIFQTMVRMFVGFSMAAILGVVLGLIAGSINGLFNFLSQTIDFCRSIPVTALYPIFVLCFGFGHVSKIAMIFWSAFFVIWLNTAVGAYQAPKTRQQMARLYGASKSQVFFLVTFWDTMPQVAIGLRIAISYSIIIAILSEMFMSSQYGIGQKITEAYTTFSINRLFALVFVVGVIGYFLNKLFTTLEEKSLLWSTRI